MNCGVGSFLAVGLKSEAREIKLMEWKIDQLKRVKVMFDGQVEEGFRQITYYLY